MSRLFESFAIPDGKGGTRMLHHFAADDRLRAVKCCTDVEQLREALADGGLQKSVRTAIKRRICSLERLP
ncbi:MAG: hypothetical protein AB7S42_12480 [Lysobacteraceae bacterium]